MSFLEITIVKRRMPRDVRRAMPGLLRSAYVSALTLWHTEFRPIHFTKRAASRYRYTPRAGQRAPRGSKAYKRSYTARKQREKGHTLPLVYTGQSRTLSRLLDIRATSRRGRVVSHARGLNRRPRDRRGRLSPIRMAKELTRLIPTEKRAMIEAFGKRVSRGVRALNVPARRERLTF